MPADFDLGDNYEINEDSSGNLVITHTPSADELRFDDTNELFEFAAQVEFLQSAEFSSLIDGAGVTHTGELADLADVVSDHGDLSGLSDDDHTQYLLVDGTRAMSGALDMASNNVNNVAILSSSTTDTDALEFNDANEPVSEVTGQTGTVTLDLSTANRFRVEADGDITIEFSNVSSSPKGNSVIIYFYDSDGTGPHTITYPTNTEWPDGNVIDTIESGSNVEIALTSDDGDATTPTWRGSLRGRGFQ